MSIRTESEELFENYCENKGVVCKRIPEGPQKSADYELMLGSTKIIAEVKQIDRNESDMENKLIMERDGVTMGGSAPTTRVKKHIANAYPQIKKSCSGKHPGMVVLYNNAGFLNRIDNFTISIAMFGDFAVSIHLNEDNNIVAGAQKFRGNRKVTKNTLRALSAVAVITSSHSSDPEFVVYHNPYANIPIIPKTFASFADQQLKYHGPHEMASGSWEPEAIEA